MIRAYNRSWTFLALLAAFAAALFAAAYVPQAADADTDQPDRAVDQRTGEKLTGRKLVIHDSFGKGQGTQLAGRAPAIAPQGAVWQVELGNWRIGKGGLLGEFSPEPWFAALDKRGYIDAGRTDVHVSSRIRHGGGEQFVGVAARYTGPVDWLMFWYDGHGTLVLGAKKTDSGLDFHDLRRAAFDWKPGERHELRLAVRDQNIRAYVDRDLVMELEAVPVVGDANYVGLFSRGIGSAEFEDFEVTGLDRIKSGGKNR